MARSRRKNPCFSITVSGFNRGEKQDKQIAHRRIRSSVNQICRSLCGEINNMALDAVIFPLQRELSDIWCFSKDGKWKAWYLFHLPKEMTITEFSRRIRIYDAMRK